MRIVPTIPLVVSLLLLCGRTGQIFGQLGPSDVLKTDGPQPHPSVLYSPDRRYYVAWLNLKADPPIGEIQPVIFRCANDAADLFSFVTTPGHTQVAWNSASTRCLISDQPNDGQVFVWLVSKEVPSEKWHWCKIDPLAPVYAAYLRAMNGRDTPLFRPYLERVEWITDTQARFLISCNLGGHQPAAAAGRYFVTMDFQAPDPVPMMKKISDQ